MRSKNHVTLFASSELSVGYSVDKFFKIKLDCSLALAISVVSDGKMKQGGGGTNFFFKTRIFNVFVKKIQYVKATKYFMNW